MNIPRKCHNLPNIMPFRVILAIVNTITEDEIITALNVCLCSGFMAAMQHTQNSCDLQSTSEDNQEMPQS